MKLVKCVLLCLAAYAVIGCSGGTEGAGGKEVPPGGGGPATQSTTGAPAASGG